jgi:hypothetical protein
MNVLAVIAGAAGFFALRPSFASGEDIDISSFQISSYKNYSNEDYLYCQVPGAKNGYNLFLTLLLNSQ